ncbi:formylglycine-generating enzyme family protein [Rubritalea tangerina]|uniref:Formylglycine-generating enzyme family protein n=1 Tax=Rubritalea tangerina TaxID=430798 RepID=A0ABW4Z6K4_9BACT
MRLIHCAIPLCLNSLTLADDINPPLHSVPDAAINAEQMRLTRVIHQKITQTHAEEKQRNTQFAPFVATLRSGIEIQMQPIKTQPFTWQGVNPQDTLNVTLDDFWMASTETTWAAYDDFYASSYKREKDGSVDQFVRPSIKDDYDLIARPTPQYYPVTNHMPKEGHSAVGVTHHAANKFCQWLSYQTGHFYRLPTEAEWEFACRAGSHNSNAWGDNDTDAKQYAWFGEAENTHYHKPALKKPNAFGLYDMHGNVLELTLDGFVQDRRKYFAKANVHNPWVKATQPYPHVTKGGTWKSPLREIKASSRIPSKAEWKKTDPQEPKSVWAFSDAPFLGFRVVRSTTIPTPEEMYHYWNSHTALDDGEDAQSLSP